ncbi:MAG: FGGY family carbohydrate kinase [Clostridia bacterium]|nr:FGGY family carbohydrate kinase [Clostridia bacterium]
MSYMGVDVGTTGCKATVVDEFGRILSSFYREYDIQTSETGQVTIDPHIVWDAVKMTIRQAASLSETTIQAIATASFGEAVALIGDDGEPVCDSIYYTDARGSESLALLRSRVDLRQFQYTTGMPLNHMYTLPKLLWIQQNQPESLRRARWILPYGSYINYMLSGECAADASLASRTLLYDRLSGDWNQNTLNAFDLRPECLPRIVSAGDPIGHMTVSVASELGIKGRPLVVAGVHDQIAAALGAGVLSSGECADSIGSTECVTAVLPDTMAYDALFANNLCVEPHAATGVYVSLAFSNAAGASLKWFRDTLEPDLRNECERQGISAYDQLNATMSQAPSPLLFLPHLAGSGTPHMDASAKGMVAGLTLHTRKSDIYRAILEGNSYEIRLNLELLSQCGLQLNALTATGGGAVPDALHIKADILQLPIHMLRTAQSGTIGMAILCGKACGQFPSLIEGTRTMVKRAATIDPRQAYRHMYDEKYGQYRNMYHTMRSIYG